MKSPLRKYNRSFRLNYHALHLAVLGLPAMLALPAAAEPGASDSGLIGLPFNEILRGNGSRAGYALSHAGIIASTLSVRAGGALLKQDQDYFIDAGSGALFFANAITRFSSISASYRYREGDTPASSLQAPSLQFQLNSHTKLGITYLTTPGGDSGIVTSTYGFAFNSDLGSHQSGSLGGLFYISDRRASTNVILPMVGSETRAAAPPAVTGTGQLIAQALNVRTGSLGFHASIQDVGAKFDGFKALQVSAAGNKPLLEQLKQLEGEKGIKRLGVGFTIGALPAGGARRGLALDLSSIQDSSGTIAQNAIGYDTRGVHLGISSRSISEKFTSFAGLREAEKADWQHQKGLKTDKLDASLGFTGKGGSGPGLGLTTLSFGDKSGGLHEQATRIATGGLEIALFDQKSNAGFKRIDNISLADKQTLALNIYRQYDPTVSTESVTAADVARLGNEAGLHRHGLLFTGTLGKSESLRMVNTQISASGDKGAVTKVTRDQIALDTPVIQVSLTHRRADGDPAKITDLSDVDRAYLALDIRSQFGLAGKPGDLAEKEKAQAAKELAVSRDILSFVAPAGKGGSLRLNDVRLGPAPTGASAAKPASADQMISRRMIAFTGPRLKLSAISQSVGEGFAHLAELSDLERQYFANEHGLWRRQVGLDWQVNKSLRASISTLQIGATDDAVSATRAALAANGGAHPEKALRAAMAGLARTDVSVEGRGLLFERHTMDTDEGFARASDLAMAPAERKFIAENIGFKRNDTRLKTELISGLKIDLVEDHAVNSAEDVTKSIWKRLVQASPSKYLLLGYTSEGDLEGTASKLNGSQRSILSLNDTIGRGYKFSLSQDNLATFADGKQASTSDVNTIHFETPIQLANRFTYDEQTASHMDGKAETSAQLNLHVKPLSTLNLTYGRDDENRRTPEKDHTAQTNALDFEYQATKGFAIIGGSAQTETNDNNNSDTVGIGLKGDPVRNLTIAAKFNEAHIDGKNTHDVADVSIGNAKPIQFGPIRELSVTAHYGSLNDKRKLQNEVMTGRATWKVLKNDFLLDYGGTTKADGQSTISRVYSFASDPNPRRPLHVNFLYKDRTLLTGKEQLIRRFAADLRLSSTSAFTYTYGTLPEDDKGNVTPITTLNVGFKHGLTKSLALDLFYRENSNTLTKSLTRGAGFGLEGSLGAAQKFAVNYSLDSRGLAAKYDRAHHFHIAYERQLNADNYITLSATTRLAAEASKFEPNTPKSDVIANVDFRTRF